jgi:hypothetical protein
MATINAQHRRITPKPVRGNQSVIEYHLTYEDGRYRPECEQGRGNEHHGEGSLRSARQRWPGVPYVPRKERV